MDFLFDLAGIILILAMPFFRLPRFVWTPVLFAVLLFVTFVVPMSTWLVIPLWAISLAVMLIINVPTLRQPWLSRPVFALLSKLLPPMSDTEREALNAGDTWWEGELFQGDPKWTKLFAMQKPRLSSAEQAFIENEVKTLCRMLDDWQVTQETKDLPPEVWKYLKDSCFFGLMIPKEEGGLGFSAHAHSDIIMMIGSKSPSAAVSVMVPNSLGPAELIHNYGTQQQKDYYLPRLARGEEIPCFGLTGTDAGSDAASIPDHGIIAKGVYEGKEQLGIKLTFDKRYITLAPVATLVGLAFRLYDPERLLGDKTDHGITLCLLPSTTRGLDIGKRHDPMGLAFMNGPVRGKDVFIPLSFIIGEEEGIGQGWRMLMECLSIGRSISLPALATTASQLSYLTTGAYSAIREQFNVPIGYFDGVQAKLAQIAMMTYSVNAMRLLTVTALDDGVRPSLVSAIAKYHMTEMGRHSVNASMDVHAGKAIQNGPMNYIAKFYTAQPISITVEGANILTRNLIIFGQGAMRCHPYVRDEIELANQGNEDAFKAFDLLLLKHLGFVARNVVRSVAYGLSAGYLAPTPRCHKALKPYLRQMTRMSTGLALVTDLAMLILGGELKRKERLSARLGDVLSQLYRASAVAKYFLDHGSQKEEVALLEACLQSSLYECQEALYAFCDNFTNKALGLIAKRLIFPFGRSYKRPSDDKQQLLARAMLVSSETRSRICENLFFDEVEDDAIGLLEVTLAKRETVQPLLDKCKRGRKQFDLPACSPLEEQLDFLIKEKVLTKSEKEQLMEYERLRLAVVKVDEFDENLQALGGEENIVTPKVIDGL